MVGNESIYKNHVPVDLVVELEEGTILDSLASNRDHTVSHNIRGHDHATYPCIQVRAHRFDSMGEIEREKKTIVERVNVSPFLFFRIVLHGVVNRTAVPRPDLQPGKRMRPAVLLLLFASCHNCSRWDWWPARCFRRFIEQRRGRMIVDHDRR